MSDHVYSENAEREMLFQTVRLGIDTENFIERDPVGRHLMAQAKDTLISVRNDLEAATPADSTRIAELQLRAQAARNVLGWLGEAISAGKNAENQLEILDAEELG